MEPRLTLDVTLLTDYVAGECTAAQQATVDQWRALHPRNERMFQQFRQMWELTRRPASGVKIDVIRQRVRELTVSGPSSTVGALSRSAQPMRRRIARGTWSLRAQLGNEDVRLRPISQRRELLQTKIRSFARAAVPLFLVLCAVGIATARYSMRHAAIPATQTARQYTVPTGQRAVVRLSDGTTITLASQSQLDIVPDSRTVILTGEAYFDVTPSNVAPFVVRTGTIETRVLGTRFDVRHYASDSIVQVSVMAGKVITTGLHTSATLTAGLIGRVTDSVSEVIPGAPATADWMRGELVFDNEPVAKVLVALKRWYGYDFHLSDSSLAGRRVHAVFPTDERRKALVALADLLDATLTVDGQNVTLRPRPHVNPVRHAPVRERFSNPTEVGK